MNKIVDINVTHFCGARLSLIEIAGRNAQKFTKCHSANEPQRQFSLSEIARLPLSAVIRQRLGSNTKANGNDGNDGYKSCVQA